MFIYFKLKCQLELITSTDVTRSIGTVWSPWQAKVGEQFNESQNNLLKQITDIIYKQKYHSWNDNQNNIDQELRHGIY